MNTDLHGSEQSDYQRGYAARKAGRRRLLFLPASGEAEREWLRGWDDADRLHSIVQRAIKQANWCFGGN